VFVLAGGGRWVLWSWMELNYAVEDLGLTFLFDIHNDQAIYGKARDIHSRKRIC